jgi:hypothetical protein
VLLGTPVTSKIEDSKTLATILGNRLPHCLPKFADRGRCVRFIAAETSQYSDAPFSFMIKAPREGIVLGQVIAISIDRKR